MRLKKADSLFLSLSGLKLLPALCFYVSNSYQNHGYRRISQTDEYGNVAAPYKKSSSFSFYLWQKAILLYHRNPDSVFSFVS